MDSHVDRLELNDLKKPVNTFIPITSVYPTPTASAYEPFLPQDESNSFFSFPTLCCLAVLYFFILALLAVGYFNREISLISKKLRKPVDCEEIYKRQTLKLEKGIRDYDLKTQLEPGDRRALILQSVNPSFYTNYHDFGSNASIEDVEERKVLGSSGPFYYRNQPNRDPLPRNIIYGFFHPYADAGGGGERVLWAAVKATLDYSPRNIAVIYIGIESSLSYNKPEKGQLPTLKIPEKSSPSSILKTVNNRFGLTFDEKRIVFIYTPGREKLDPSSWPKLTLFFQAVASFLFAYKAITQLAPDAFIDTMGYPFSYPVARWIAKVPIEAYVHYPVISNDMLSAMLNNSKTLSGTFNGLKSKFGPLSPVLTWGKFMYWKLFSFGYTLVGSYVDIVLVNSSWTLAHMKKQWSWGHPLEAPKSSSKKLVKPSENKSEIPSKNFDYTYIKYDDSIWYPENHYKEYKFDYLSNDEDYQHRLSQMKVVYPPCATQDLENSDLSGSSRNGDIIYVAQFRPEKRHNLVLQEFKRFKDLFEAYKKAHTGEKLQTPRLVLIGSVRNEKDKEMIFKLRAMCKELDLTEETDVQFVLDAPWSTVTEKLSKGTIGVNAMWNEHFGMVVVEYMAAGLIPVVHNSGGPKLDIVIPYIENADKEAKPLPTGFKFKSKEDPPENYETSGDENENTKTLSEALLQAYTLPEDVKIGYRKRARKSSTRFSDETFANSWKLKLQDFEVLVKRKQQERVKKGIYD